MGGLIAVAVATALAIVGGSGGEDARKPSAPVELERTVLGRGAEAVAVVAPRGIPSPAPTIIFLHGWGEFRADDYRAWIDHLAEQGNVVIVPRYQTSTASPPDTVLAAALTGIRTALDRRSVAPGTLVVVGHSAGAALAADYAATAADDASLPAPLGIYGVFPGRAILGYPAGIPAVEPVAIPRPTRIIMLGGNRDTVVGTSPALELLSNAISVPAEFKRYVEVTGRRLSDHYAPLRDDRRIRQTFWEPLDQLIEDVR